MLDSDVERMSFECLLNGVPPGHYKLPFIERLAPRTKAHGAGRMYIADLTSRDVKALQEDERAEVTLDDEVKIGGYASSIGRLRALGDVKCSIHAGGETLSWSLGQANYQPLTQVKIGGRLHNQDLNRAMDFIAPRLFCGQLIVLTVTK